ncbi:hypothetical protein [Actinomadura rayongensis]|uniref:Uncharacterized protein n=1 Tax=Actinomadura rayongensis TaxID=1429076 RepID=A0A6I4WAG5_9ACTN|nr:hypothetical protein [Actinomadura rayongensis]MXQ65275.1 hypothetical protein [Actinomadura rayongensis]
MISDDQPADTTPPPSREQVHEALRATVRHGALAANLTVFTPTVIDLLVPPNGDEESNMTRAAIAEDLIRKGITAVEEHDGPAVGSALRIMLGLASGTAVLSVEERRRQAARAIGIQPDTFRRDNHSRRYFLELAFAIHSLIESRSAGAR